MANLIYASIDGEKQGLISAGCSTLDSIGNRYQLGMKIKYTFMHLIII